MEPDNSQATTFPRTDHDLLIEVSTNVKNLTTTIHGYNTSNIAIAQDHEGRLRALEKVSDNQNGALRTLKWVIGIAVTILAASIGYVATLNH